MLITPRHRQRYQQYYAAPDRCVVRPHAWQPVVDQLVVTLGAASVLDYGCGVAGNLARYAGYPVQQYDPGVPAFRQRPEPADLVVCVHVLEHVARWCLNAVLQDMRALTLRAIYCVVSCRPSTKMLPDDTPWHTIVEAPGWWNAQMHTVWAPATFWDPPGLAPFTEYRSVWAFPAEEST